MEEVTRLVSSGDCVKIWDSMSMAPLEQFSPHSISHPVAQVCWTSNNQYLVSSSSVGDKVVVSSLKSSPVTVIELAEGKMQTRVCLSSSSQYLVSGGLDHYVHIWDLKTRRLHRLLKDHKEEVTCVSFNANDSYIASGSTSGEIILHSLTTNLSSKAFGHGTNQPIHDLKLSTLKRSLLGTVSDSGTVVLWDSNTQKELHVFEGAHKAPASGLAFSPVSELLFVTVGLDKKIICYDTVSRIVLRGIPVESPLTAVDFNPDGTGLVVGSTQGKIYQYDLRNSSAPTSVTIAHKTSVTCLRYQNSSKLKSSKVVSSKVSSSRRLTSKLSSGTGPAPSAGEKRDGHTPGGPGVEVFSREGEGQQRAEQLPAVDKPSSASRCSLDMFSPAREDTRMLGTNGDRPPGRGQAMTVDGSSREGEGQPVRGRTSLDVFSPVRDDSSYPVGPPNRKTPLGTPGTRCYSPLSVFQTTPPIKEEEPVASAAAEPCDSTKSDKGDGSSPQGEEQITPTSSAQTNYSQPAPPEPSLRRPSGLQDQLSSGRPLHGVLPTSAAGSALLAATASSLSQSIVEAAGGQGGDAPLTSLQIHFIQNMIHETLEDFRDACHRDIVNLQVEMVRQFYIQLNEIHSLIEKYSVNDSLVEEIEKLREENRRLKTNF
ncbi:protein NEDD1 isoform X2 [Lampris incognitus]|uniref:protein NEDD1 isoform X2 n=1 Tax=Lampris incognitus TaxID=2546036 RepID=UPI0024B5443D|nr:protein NEDD1 isoform X2 [Lampris incognitus]